MKEPTVETIFPQPFLRVNLEDQLDDDIRTEIAALKDYALDDSKMKVNHNSSFISRDFQVLQGSQLNQLIQQYVDFFSRKIKGEAARQSIIISWLTLNKKGSYHIKHAHKNSIISGVFYLKCNENSGKFKIHKPNEFFDLVSDDIVDYNFFNYTHMWYIPKPYDLFLFNSYMAHDVTQNLSDEPRISLAFNTFYCDPIGNDSYYLPVNNRTDIKD